MRSVLLMLCVAVSLEAVGEVVVAGREGRVSVTVLTGLDALPLNTMHSWRVRLVDSDGEPLSGARVEVGGGMPMHDHGLPTEPTATETEPGEYRVDGVRFHMHGHWELTLEIREGGGSGESGDVDTVTIKFEL